jgi:curved DNA-binding protein CbpA
MVEQAFAGFTALPAPKNPNEVLGVRSGASRAEIEAAYREKAKRAHPDAGGSEAAMAELNSARDQLRERAAA